MAELKPCPKCDTRRGVYVVTLAPYKDLFAVECTICGDFISGYRTEEKAIEAWNRRAGDGNGGT